MTDIDGRTRRAKVRHAAWGDLARAAVEDVAGPPEVADSAKLRALYYEERREALEYLRKRSRGVLASPPGGVGRGK